MSANTTLTMAFLSELEDDEPVEEQALLRRVAIKLDIDDNTVQAVLEDIKVARYVEYPEDNHDRHLLVITDAGIDFYNDALDEQRPKGVVSKTVAAALVKSEQRHYFYRVMPALLIVVAFICACAAIWLGVESSINNSQKGDAVIGLAFCGVLSGFLAWVIADPELFKRIIDDTWG